MNYYFKNFELINLQHSINYSDIKQLQNKFVNDKTV